MKVSLNIENDKELRAHVKDLIRGQVLSITREEMTEVITKEICRKLNSMESFNVERSMKIILRDMARQLLTKWNFKKLIEPIIESTLDENNIDLKKLVEQVADEKILKLARAVVK